MTLRWEWGLVAGPDEEPITVPYAKAHARIRHDREDALIDGYITVGREAGENHMNRALLTQTRKVILSGFAETIPLPWAAPLQNDALATPSTVPVVTYYDADNVLQTLASTAYVVNTTKQPAQLERAPGTAWPSVQSERQYPVIVTYVAGWTSADQVPALVKQGILLWVASLDADRLGSEQEAAQKAARTLWDYYMVTTPDPQWCEPWR